MPFDIEGFAAQLAHHPEAARRLIREHEPNDSGYCKGCVLHDRPTNRWPCVLRAAALQAMRIYTQD